MRGADAIRLERMMSAVCAGVLREAAHMSTLAADAPAPSTGSIAGGCVECGGHAARVSRAVCCGGT